ncbi:MAG: phage terminase large subunit [Nitrospirae bacterium]|nr:phage terminase large subunit [Nitrospirota bacterium]
MTMNLEDLDIVSRTDLTTFVERAFRHLNPGTQLMMNWHIERIATVLMRVARGEVKRVIINIPPRNMKSIIASVAFPAWLLGHDPSKQIICVSYAQPLADKLARDCRQLMMSYLYRGVFPGTRLTGGKQAVSEFETSKNWCRLATSVGGVLTGRGADVLIIDDALKPDEALSYTQRQSVNDWFAHTLLSRLNDKVNGAIIIISQRLHEDDLPGFAISQGGWEVVSIPAIAVEDEVHLIESAMGSYRHVRLEGEVLHPEREPKEVLDVLRRTLGEYHFAAQYQQTPAPLGGGIVKLDWFVTYEPRELPETMDRIFQSWDTASKANQLNDYSVCTTWGQKGQHVYLLHVLRKRLEYPELKRSVREQAGLWGAKTVIIEDKGSGTQLVQELRNESFASVLAFEPKSDKVVRMHTQAAMIENGFVHIPVEAPWLGDYLHELATFPKGKFDDQVDSTSQALEWVRDTDLQPNFIIYIREDIAREAQRRGGGRTRPVRVMPHNGVSAWQISGGPELRADNEGVITIPVGVEAPIPNGWIVLDD